MQHLYSKWYYIKYSMEIEVRELIPWTVIYDTNNWQFIHTPGKYMFFSKERSKLISLAKQLITAYGFKQCKVNQKLVSPYVSYVLCVYSETGELDQELKQYKQRGKIQYKGWKEPYDEN